MVLLHGNSKVVVEVEAVVEGIHFFVAVVVVVLVVVVVFAVVVAVVVFV